MRTLIITAVCVTLTASAFAQSLYKREGIRDDRREITYAITNAIIIPEAGKQANSMLVKHGHVIDIGNNITIPKEAVVVDLNGKYIYPSFIELNSDYGLDKPSDKKPKSTPEYERQDGKSAFGWNRAIRPNQQAEAHYQNDEKRAKALRKQGVGVVLTHLQDGIIRGTGSLVALADMDEQYTLLRDKAARFYSLEKGSSTQQYPSSQMGAIALLRQTYYDLKWYEKQKDLKERHLHLEALQNQQSLPAFFVVQDKLSALRALKIGDEFNEQYIVLGKGDEYQRIDDIAGTKGVFVLPMNFPDVPDISDPFMAREVGLRDLKHWELAPYNARILHDHKVPFALSAASTDKPFEALHSIRKTGVSNDVLLASLTSTPAELIGVNSELGKLKTGMLANFFVCKDSLSAAKNQIYEHWVLGVRHRISDPGEFKIDGHYLVNQRDTLRLKTKNTFTYVTLDSVVIHGKYNRNNNRISIQYRLDDEHVVIQSTATGSNRLENATIWKPEQGTALTPINLTLHAADTAETVDSATHLSDDFDYRSALWKPFQAFGTSKSREPATYLVQNATIWTLQDDNPVCEGCDVIIEKGRIKAVGSTLKAPNNSIVIDGTDKHLTPGMIDEHSHIAISRGVNEAGSSISSEVRIGDVINPEDINIYRQLSGGTTASQLLHGSANTIGGQSAIVKLRWGASAEAMKINDAPEFIKFALGENVKQSNWGDRMKVRYPQSRMGVEQILYEHFHRAQAYAQNSDKNKRVDLELEALAEILRSDRHISCHSYIQSEINMLMTVADSMRFKVNTFTHVLEGYKLADKMKTHGAAGSTFSDWWAYKMEVNEAIPFNAAAMAQAGVTTAINSDDAEMGRRLNQEAGKVLRYGGNDEVEALKMVTFNPAKMLHLDHRMGRIQKGYDADVVLWNNHPLSIYAKAEKTFVDGILYFDRDAHDSEVAAMRAERSRLINKARKAAGNGAKLAQPESEVNNEYHCDTLDEIHHHEK